MHMQLWPMAAEMGQYKTRDFPLHAMTQSPEIEVARLINVHLLFIYWEIAIFPISLLKGVGCSVGRQ